MANVLDLRRRIRSVKSTRQITKAMKMVSAAKLRRAQERAIAGRPYARMLASVLESLRNRAEVYDPTSGECRHPLLMTRPEKNVLLVVVTGDKGFAGAFNANIVKAAFQFLDDHKDVGIDIEAIGRKGRDLVRKRFPAATYLELDENEFESSIDKPKRSRTAPVEVTGDHPGILQNLVFEHIDELGSSIAERYVHEEIDAAYVVYNEFKSVLSQRVVIEKILPIIEIGKSQVTSAVEPGIEELERVGEAAVTAGVSTLQPDTVELDEEARKFGTSAVDYIYEQPPEELFRRLLPRYVTTLLFHAMLESVAGEHAARMTAMDSATNNASDMIDSYTLLMNRVRQAKITNEIIEIVSGAAAL
ncbi:MAG TPA: FoF1 ATP synthase subunit gamma [Acidisarcina sp.]|nr:FoF1 ATP synthase subunit gamma [Acidisarcina sp.]